ncbi:MAG: UTP--glucose-1-phosphate uridylyltransferase [Bryobacterales bacterium]|nr:UTP--glucose-1-phosphate uridylyltransferase [Bryobacterales bacterium]
MSRLVGLITAAGEALRDEPLSRFCSGATAEDLFTECGALDAFQNASSNLYERVRAQFFLSAIYRYYLPPLLETAQGGVIPHDGIHYLLERRFEEAIRSFQQALSSDGASESLATALAAAYHGLGFQTLADQVRRSVRLVSGNRWMFRMGHPLDHPLTLHEELLKPSAGAYPTLAESTPVRMDLSHSGWSDIFFLGMDYPQGARVLNVSIDLSVRDRAGDRSPRPPIQTYLRVIDEPVLRLVSVDLKAQADLTCIDDVFDFGRDHLGLLKAAVIASGLIPAGLEACGLPLAPLLATITGKKGHGLELVSSVNEIPRGSRLAVSTNLLASLIALCMRATKQVSALTGGLEEKERRLIAARAILGEWLGGSGGGWQDSGGVWPGIKLIEGCTAKEGDPEFGISRGTLLPRHRVFDRDEISDSARRKLQDSLVLVHGGMAQDVGPILEMVTERYLLRSEREWQSRQQAQRVLDEILGAFRAGDIERLGGLTHANFAGPIRDIVPWAGNHYTDLLIDAVRQRFGARFWGFWMLGGMAGGGMGFVFDPAAKAEALTALGEIMLTTKRRLETALPFGMDPVVYDFAINERGTHAELLRGGDALLPPAYYTLRLPPLVRQPLSALTQGQRSDLALFGEATRTRPAMAPLAAVLLDHLLPHDQPKESSDQEGSLPQLLSSLSFDKVQHETVRAALLHGRVGLAHNSLPSAWRYEDVTPGEIVDARRPMPASAQTVGEEALRSGAVAVLTLAGGAGSRWTGGAGVVKAINPFIHINGAWRSFLEIQLARSARSMARYASSVPHVVTTSYLTHGPIREALNDTANYGYPGPLYLSEGRSVGLRLVPMVRDLRFLWEQTPQQALDEQKQKVRDSVRAALAQWATAAGEGSDYRDNLPSQCLHPVGHWYEFPNMLLNGVLGRLLAENPRVRYIQLLNVDTLGANLDAGLLGAHILSGSALSVEVMSRAVDDRGGGLSKVNGRIRLVEGLALPDESIEYRLSYYNSGTMWMDVDQILSVFGLSRNTIGDSARVTQAVRETAARVPTYITIKDVKKRWGHGQEDIFPVSQYEKIWGDMTALPDLSSQFMIVPRKRGQQLKQVAQLDSWLRDGSAAYVEALCRWA